ncbi:poly-beta-1,6-N-acetyl-D-glucosamine biosynthesis protein PgaD [Cognatilysobacter lacus]|nr:poly-beta-1,6-N-acetyl-D-glucosamine biosynthesis protein PgaD [Lysobacter lacus]
MNAQNPVEHPFIYRPETRVPTATRTLHGAITLVAWMIYAYLWLPVLTAIAWYLGVRTAFVEIYVRNNRIDNGVFLAIGVMALIAIALLVGWAEYNRRKFGRHDRRGAPRQVDAYDVGDSMFAPLEVSQRLSRAKLIRLEMSHDARPLGVHHDAPMPGQL